ncbi:glucose-6-phosphate dehydrogenase [Arthrobacter sp. E918]|uniref:Glucose-6-phosphate 1-dehydrogenase n=1 Tax=Arthrobacter mobilis TaxID=2724944 RepID=A0A7X6HDW0_9MICC|nr:glucose-6-phosphate dehydrogenase [Arthrobacter mobilis]
MRTLLILGASGDLTGRLLLPGLGRLLALGRTAGLTLVGAGSDDWSRQQWRDRVAGAFRDCERPDNDNGVRQLRLVAGQTDYHRLDVTAKGALAGLLAALEGPVAVFFALPPAVSQKACEVLGPADIPEGTRLVLEKPFGSSLESARSLNRTLLRLVPEENIHRVDHFLGKATVFNILGLRFANRLLEPLFSNQHVAKVEIYYDESLALEGRARYYDHAGALRDMIQSHLLQVMALMALNAPASLKERDLRDHIGSVLRASSVNPDFARSTRRARYTAGDIEGRRIPDYTAEAGIDPSRGTETLAEIEVSINNERWAGVPFILRSGKALGRPQKEAIVTFKPVNHLPTGFKGVDEPTRLRIGFGPETLRLEIDVNGPGDIFTLDRAVMEAQLHSADLLPYGEVLEGVLAGDPLLSVRGDIAEDCWRIVEPVLQAWAENQVPLEEYPAGSHGPAGWGTSRQDRPLE